MNHLSLLMKLSIILTMVAALWTCMPKQTPDTLDFQGHRGCRGLVPENSIPAFLKALDYPIQTLEMDAAISKDGKVILSHDPWFHPDICVAPDTFTGKPLNEWYIKDLTYSEIKQFDCGSKGNPRFPEQQAMPVYKPTLDEVVAAVNRYCNENQRAQPHYNIEIKTRPDWDEKTVSVDQFAEILVATLQQLNIAERSCIQSFDIRALQATRQIDSTITLAFLTEKKDRPQFQLDELGFVPEIYSPFYLIVDKDMIDYCHQHKMKVIPWTVNDASNMQKLIDLGVDGIITDYPDLIEVVMR